MLPMLWLLPSLLIAEREQSSKVGEQAQVWSGHDGTTTGHDNCLSDLARAR